MAARVQAWARELHTRSATKLGWWYCSQDEGPAGEVWDLSLVSLLLGPQRRHGQKAWQDTVKDLVYRPSDPPLVLLTWYIREQLRSPFRSPETELISFQFSPHTTANCRLQLLEQNMWSWREGSVVKNTGCISRGPEFNS